jgi:hypothetical protein
MSETAVENEINEKGRLEIKQIKPKEEWVYCKYNKEYICFENFIYFESENIKVELDEPILAISVSENILVRTKSKIVLLTKAGEIIWQKKVKASAICHYKNYIAFSKGKKLIVFDTTGNKIFSKKVKDKINAIDINDEYVLVGSRKGIHVFRGKELVWELMLGNVTLVRVGNVILSALEDELVVISLEGELLLKKKFDSVIYNLDFEGDSIRVHLFGGHVIKLTLDGNILEVYKEEYDFKFLPLPWITVKRELEKIKESLDYAKKIKPKNVKKMIKIANKLFKKCEYGKAYELILKATDELRTLQLQVVMPKKASIDDPFTVTVRVHNFFDEVLENVEVDLTDFEKYFEISEKIINFPPIKKGMYIEKSVEVVPKFEGLLMVEASAKFSWGEVHRTFQIRIKRKRSIFRFRSFKKKEEKEESLLDLLK